MTTIPPDAPQSREARLDAALERIGRRLDDLEVRKSDAALGSAFRQGRGIVGPVAAIVAVVVGALVFVETRAAAIARTTIDSAETRGQVADQIHAQIDPIVTEVARLRESLRLDARLQRIEDQLATPTTPPTAGRPPQKRAP